MENKEKNKKQPHRDDNVYVMCVDDFTKVAVESKPASCFHCNRDIWASVATISDAMKILPKGNEVRFICMKCALPQITPDNFHIGRDTVTAAFKAITKNGRFSN